jgi:hypothetical protein
VNQSGNTTFNRYRKSGLYNWIMNDSIVTVNN